MKSIFVSSTFRERLYRKNGSESSRQLLETAHKNLNDIEKKCEV